MVGLAGGLLFGAALLAGALARPLAAHADVPAAPARGPAAPPAPPERLLQALFRPEFRSVPVLLDALRRFGLEGARVEPMGPWLEELRAGKQERVASRLLLEGTRPELVRLSQALARLDIPVPSVAVAVTVAEVRRRFARETGGFLRFERDSGSGASDSVFRGTQGTFEPESWLRSQLTGVLPFQGTTLKLGRFEAGQSVFEHVLRALAQDHDAEILARTTLVAGEGAPARLESLVRLPSLLLARADVSSSGETQVEFVTRPVEAGLTFDLSAVRVSHDGAVLDLKVQFTTAEPSAVPGAAPGDLVLRTRRLETRLTARDGETLVVGGLSLTRNLGDRRSMPLLDQVPALDVLVSADGNQRETTELIFVLTPRVLSAPEMDTPTLDPALLDAAPVVAEPAAAGPAPFPPPRVSPSLPAARASHPALRGPYGSG